MCTVLLKLNLPIDFQTHMSLSICSASALSEFIIWPTRAVSSLYMFIRKQNQISFIPKQQKKTETRLETACRCMKTSPWISLILIFSKTKFLLHHKKYFRLFVEINDGAFFVIENIKDSAVVIFSWWAVEIPRWAHLPIVVTQWSINTHVEYGKQNQYMESTALRAHIYDVKLTWERHWFTYASYYADFVYVHSLLLNFSPSHPVL